jgi:hypothetical protein
VSQFTGEESFGRFLDLHEHYLNFLNLKQNKGKPIDYTDYLMSLHTFDDRLEAKDQPYRKYVAAPFSLCIVALSRRWRCGPVLTCVVCACVPCGVRVSVVFVHDPFGDLLLCSLVFYSYLQLVLEYLITWYRRAKPLTNVDGLLKEAEEDLEKSWADGNWTWARAEREEKDKEHEKLKSENSASASSVRLPIPASGRP